MNHRDRLRQQMMDDERGQMNDAQLAALFQKLQQSQEMAPLEMNQARAHTGLLQEQTRKLQQDQETSPENNALRSASYLGHALSSAYTPETMTMLTEFLRQRGVDLPAPQAPVDSLGQAILKKVQPQH